MSLVFGDSLRKSSQARAAAVPARRILIYAMNHAPEFVGVGRYTGEIADHLAASGANVTVITTPPHYPDWSVPLSRTACGCCARRCSCAAR